MSNEVLNPYQQFLDATGDVLENGTLTFNVNLTSTLSTIYSDEALTVPQSNPYTLDAAGRVIGDIRYVGKKRVIVKDQTGATVRTLDNVVTAADFSADLASYAKNYATVPLLKAATDTVAGQIYSTTEHTSGYGYKGRNLYLARSVTGGTDDNGSLIKSTGNTAIEFVGLFPNGKKHVHQFGAAGDGSTDDTTAIKACFSAMSSSGDEIVFGSGLTYMFTPDTAFGINMQSNTNFIVRGNHSTLKAPDGEASAANGVFLWLEGCEDGLVENLTLDGNLPNRTGSEGSGAHDVKLRSTASSNNQRITFRNCKFINAITDGFSIDTSDASNIGVDIKLLDCEATGCYRGGAGIIDSERLTIRGGRYYSNGIGGTNPKFGIDFEDNNIGGNIDFIVEDVDIYSNAGEGIQISGTLGATSSKLKNVRLWDNGNQVAADVGSEMRIGLFDGLVMEDIYFKGNSNTIARALLDFVSAASNDLTMKNINFIDANPSGGSKYCIYMHSSITGEVDTEGLTISGTNSIGFHCDVDDVSIRGFTVRNSTAGNIMTGSGDRAYIADMKMFNNALAPIVGGDNCIVDGFHSVNCASTSNNIFFAGSAATLRNALVQQASSIPSGQKGYAFQNAPLEITNVKAISAGTDFDGSDIFNFVGGVSDSTVMSAISPGFWTEKTVSADNGDAAVTLTRGTSEQTQLWDTAITADRAVTLSTTNARSGDRFRIIRTANATGAFNLNVGTGPLKAMGTAGSFCEVEYDGSAWILSAYSVL